jgi:putrescine aminotransferase
MLAVEFVACEVGYAVAKGMFARGVMTAGTLVNAKCVRFEPAAVISYEDMDQVIPEWIKHFWMQRKNSLYKEHKK